MESVNGVSVTRCQEQLNACAKTVLHKRRRRNLQLYCRGLCVSTAVVVVYRMTHDEKRNSRQVDRSKDPAISRLG